MLHVTVAVLTEEGIVSAQAGLRKIFQDYVALLADTHLASDRKKEMRRVFEMTLTKVSVILQRHGTDLTQECSLYRGELISKIREVAGYFERVFIGSASDRKSELQNDAIAFFALFDQKLKLKPPKSMLEALG